MNRLVLPRSKAPAAPPFAIRNAAQLTATGPVIQSGTILVRDGKIVGLIRSILPICRAGFRRR